jgi:lipid-A-disaccharide synthase
MSVADALPVAREVARIAAAAALLPIQLFEHSLLRDARRAELATDIDSAPLVPEPVPAYDRHAPHWKARPLELVVSCAEASGEIHARTWLAALRGELAALGAPEPRVRVLGGPAFDADRVERIADPVSRAAMGLGGIAAQAPYYLGLARDFARALRTRRADLYLPVDSPALHVPLARIARRSGAGVVHLVAPQYWGWAPWRASGYPRAVDLCLCLLAFERAWFERRGIATRWVGHPLLDVLPMVPHCPSEPDARPPCLALLPGSRGGLIDRSLPWMLERAAAVRTRVPALRVLVFQERADQVERVQRHLERARALGWATWSREPLHGGLQHCRAAFSVSGTVLLDLLHHRIPAVVVYPLANAYEQRLRPSLLDAPFIALPNLIANRRNLPEYAFAGAGPRQAVEHDLERALVDRDWRSAVRRGLDAAARRLGPPGAAQRAAGWTLAYQHARIQGRALGSLPA